MITTNRQSLSQALDRCAKMTPRRSTMPILAHALLACKDGQLTYRSTNMQCEVSGSLPAAGGDRFTVDPGDMANAVASLAGDTVTITPSAGFVSVTGSTKRAFKLATLEAEDFPAALAVGGATVSLDAVMLADMLRSVAHAAPEEDGDRPQLCRVNIARHGSGLRAIATKGHCVAIRDVEHDADLRLDIPLELARQLAALKTGTVSVASDDRGMSFETGGQKLVALTPMGDFPPIGEQCDVIRPEHAVTVKAETLLDCVRAVSRVDSSRDLCLRVSCGLLVVECSGQGSARDEIEVTATADGEVWLNSEYVQAALAVVNGDVAIGYGASADPVVFEQTGWRFIIMPMRPETVQARKGK